MSFRTAYGYTHSENGWRMVNRDGCVVANPTPYSNTAPVRIGVAATIMNAWLIYYHRHIEPIQTPIWGWSNTNDVPNSNHLSGTAFDVHAPRYPWGYRTMNATIKARVEEGLRTFEGTIYWGARWGKPDEMHYQVAFPEGDARLQRFADKLNAGHLGLYQTATPPPPPPNVIDLCRNNGHNNWLGTRLHAAEKDAARGGKYVEYDAGRIYWHPNTGAQAIPYGPLWDAFKARKWEQTEARHGGLGYPIWHISKPLRDGGLCMSFEGGVLYVGFPGAPKAGALVTGVIGKRWAAEGFENGPSGYPLGDERDYGAGKIQDFETTAIGWHPSGAVKLPKEGQ